MNRDKNEKQLLSDEFSLVGESKVNSDVEQYIQVQKEVIFNEKS